MRQPTIRSRRRLLRCAAAAIVSASALTAPSRAGAQACPCAKRDLATLVKQADVIFVGKPLAATTDSAHTAARPAVEYQARFAFDVALVLKGSTLRSTTVVTPAGACGYAIAVGGEYLIAGKKHGGVVVTDVCQGNVAGADAIRTRAAAGVSELRAAPPSSRRRPSRMPGSAR